MPVEDRRQARAFLRVDCNLRGCHVRISGDYVPIMGIFDVSPLGAGIELPVPLQQGTALELRYRSRRGRIAVPGVVAWSAAHRPPQHAQSTADAVSRFRTGICFAAMEGLTGLALLDALREHIEVEELIA